MGGMTAFLLALGITAASLVLLAFSLTLVHRAMPGLAERARRAPLLDVIVALFTWVPWPIAAVLGGWQGFAGAFVGQLATMFAWCWGHELLHREALRGPRIVSFINRRVGRLANHAALWVTVVVLPLFWFIRFAQVFLYPLLVLLLSFPRYKQAEWINVSRHKFDGLVGHDLIWCLYCDWMTGVYSLGAEMLRNVESFWCPIRFYDGKKCDNCKLDFPDIDGGWVRPDGNMTDVGAVMEEKYGEGRPASWFGHPTRLTVEGQEPAKPPA